MKNLIMIFITVALFSVCVGSVTAADSIFKLDPERVYNAKTAEPGLTYGKTDKLPLPKTILFCVGVDELIADAEEWSRRGINAFFVQIAREWSSDIWASDGKPWTIGESDETLRKMKKANAICRRIGSDTFLKIAFDHTFEWFNDIAWQRINNNFRQFAIFAREAGCTGITIDIEYINEQYAFSWDGYTYDGYTKKDLVAKIRQRMTRVMSILYDEFPDMVFLTFPECGYNLGTLIQAAWIEEAARRNAPGGIHYCTEYTYYNVNINYMFAQAWWSNQLFQNILSKKARRYWQRKCSISAGVWPFGRDSDPMYSPTHASRDFRQGFAASLMMSSRYSWIYSSRMRKQLLGREMDKYTGEEPAEAYFKIMVDKDVVTTPKYVDLAKELRAMVLRDYSTDLGIELAHYYLGPNDEIRESHMPVALYETSPHFKRRKEMADLALRRFRGEDINYHRRFGTQTHWMLIGPFPNDANYSGYDTVYPPEQSIDLNGTYQGLPGRKLAWVEHNPEGNNASVNLAAVFTPRDYVCAYVLCYVTAPEAMDVQLRLCTNDSSKLWLGGKLIFENPQEGRIILDKNVIPVTLPKGTVPILLKVCQGEADWGFIFRITDADGRPLKNLRFSPTAPIEKNVFKQDKNNKRNLMLAARD